MSFPCVKLEQVVPQVGCTTLPGSMPLGKCKLEELEVQVSPADPPGTDCTAQEYKALEPVTVGTVEQIHARKRAYCKTSTAFRVQCIIAAARSIVEDNGEPNWEEAQKTMKRWKEAQLRSGQLVPGVHLQEVLSRKSGCAYLKQHWANFLARGRVDDAPRLGRRGPAKKATK